MTMDARLVDRFADEEDAEDAPELHLVGLRPGELIARLVGDRVTAAGS